MHSETPIYRPLIYRKPQFTAAISFPQIGFNIIYNVNNQNPDLPPVLFLSPELHGKSGYY